VTANYGTIGGGQGNTAKQYATVAGGASNDATGEYSTVAGGTANFATGKYSFAAGRKANTHDSNDNSHNGAFVWGDDTDTIARSQRENQVVFQASGGFVIAPESDKTTMLDVQDQAGNSVLEVDTKNDKVKADAYTSNSVTIDDNSVHSFTPPENFGKLLVHDGNAEVGEVLFDISTPAITELSDLNGNIVTDTGGLTGSGHDGNLAISAYAGGTQIDIQNQLGGQRTIHYTVIQ
jgi:hypothetical protein